MPKLKMRATQQLPILIAILLFGFFTRMIYLDVQSIWADEAFTYIATQSDTFWQTIAADVHPPLYFMMITGWSWLAGTSEFSLRLPSVLSGMVAMAGLVAITREILRHRPHPYSTIIPLIAVLLFALSDLEVMVAQEARSYTFHGIWVTFSVLYYLRWIRTNNRLDAMLFVVHTLLILFTHYIGVFTPISLGFHALCFLRGRQRIITIGLLIVSALIFLPWVWFVIIAQQIGKFAGDVVPAYQSNLGTLWYFRLSWLTDQWALMLALFALGLLVLERTVSGYKVHRPQFSMVGLLILWISVPLMLAFFLNLWLPVLFDYRLTQITIPIVIVTAYGLANVDDLARWVLIIVIVLYGVFIVDVYRPKLPWELYTDQLTEFVSDNQAIITEFGGGDYTLDYYLPSRIPASVARASVWQWLKDTPETYESGLLGFADSYDTVWLARWIDRSDAEVKLRATGHTLTMRREFLYQGNQLEILRFDRIPEQSIIRYENGIILQNAVIHSDGLIDLWWQTDTDLSIDYTISIKVFDDAGQVLAQEDIQPQFGTQSTSTWQIGQVIYDPHDLAMPLDGLQVTIQVYQWQADGLILLNTESGTDIVTLP
ncbi:MAG: glycosyltransferase family 39 protein [Phototrophicaceae bacterium]